MISLRVSEAVMVWTELNTKAVSAQGSLGGSTALIGVDEAIAGEGEVVEDRHHNVLGELSFTTSLPP